MIHLFVNKKNMNVYLCRAQRMEFLEHTATQSCKKVILGTSQGTIIREENSTRIKLESGKYHKQGIADAGGTYDGIICDKSAIQ